MKLGLRIGLRLLGFRVEVGRVRVKVLYRVRV